MSNRKRKTENSAVTGPFYAPLMNLSYDDQLTSKSRISGAVISLVKDGLTKRSSTSFYPVPDLNPEIISPLHLPVDPVTGYPYAYRNKCEFTIGLTKSGVVDIGFCQRNPNYRFSDPKKPRSVTDSTQPILVFPLSGPSSDYPIVNPSMLTVIQLFKTHVLETNPSLSVFDRANQTGIWRMLSMRRNDDNQFSLMVQTCLFSSSEDQQQDTHELVKSVLTDFQNSHSSLIHSIYLQQNKGLTDACTDSAEFITGDKSGLPMSLLDNHLKFNVSPNSFFQTNTKACEMLYSLVADWSIENSTNLKFIFDLCCGVGTISQFIYHQLIHRKNELLPISHNNEISIIGIDIVDEAIQDANKNASRNFPDLFKSKQLTFIAGKVEDKIDQVLKEQSSVNAGEVLCVVDPPRAGLHQSVLRAIRDNGSINKLIYVSCNYETLSRDLVFLLENLSDVENDPSVSKPFKLEKIQTVDMFPHTDHAEVVCKLVR
jgi:tRNA/tmRNA/rRNA uracil-C5-methylase (TrmA/RlmC/RlmD family)